jgi:xanthine/uracil permease
MLLLCLQHLFAMFGATVLVPILVQSYGLPLSIQTTLLFAGLGTLFFHLCAKLKVPAFLGSSFAFLGGFEAMGKLDSGIYANMSGAEKLPYALGGVVVAADYVGAGAGDKVLLVTGTAATKFSMEAPVDAAVVAIIDPEERHVRP